MKKNILFKFFNFFFILIFSLALVSCDDNSGGNDITIDENGNIKPGADGAITTVKFWGWGGSEETEVFKEIVDTFNKKYDGIIKVDYIQKPATGYATNLLTTLAGSKGPDVFYVKDDYYKQYASLNYLYDITELFNESKVISEEEMFPGIISRYRYDSVTTTSNADDPLLGLPKDLAPTAIYYNATQLKQAGVKIISLTEDEALAAGYTVKGFDLKTKVFNNKIAMSWSDCIELSKLLMSTGASEYGFFSEWWFNYAWSVGGDCVEYIPSNDSQYNGGYYQFTLNDSSKNYIVKDEFEGSMTVGSGTYSAGQIISYLDKAQLTSAQKANCNELPSQREAFTEFVRLSQKSTVTVDNVKNDFSDVSKFYGADSNGDIKGYAITPNPTTIAADGKTGYFTSGKVSMLVNTMSSVKQVRANMKDEWDVCPVLQYKEYSSDGKSVILRGKQAAHSGSVGIAVNAKSSIPNASYCFAEFIASAEGQSIQASEGWAIPIQKSVANSDVFLNSAAAPENIQVFIDACEYETAGDWWLLSDSKWIDDWANLLNGDVRNGDTNLSQFYKSDVYLATQSKLDEYTKK